MAKIPKSAYVRATANNIADLVQQAKPMYSSNLMSAGGQKPPGLNSPFNSNSRAKTLGRLLNLDTFQVLNFQFNPTDIPWNRSTRYSEIFAPGMSYPKTQYVGGEAREFPMDLFYYDRPFSGKITEAIDFIEQLMPPYWNDEKFEKPPLFGVYYGFLHCTCVLLDFRVKEMVQDRDGQPIQAILTLSVRQVQT